MKPHILTHIDNPPDIIENNRFLRVPVSEWAKNIICQFASISCNIGLIAFLMVRIDKPIMNNATVLILAFIMHINFVYE